MDEFLSFSSVKKIVYKYWIIFRIKNKIKQENDKMLVDHFLCQKKCFQLCDYIWWWQIKGSPYKYQV